jgi:hypothetical protein
MATLFFPWKDPPYNLNDAALWITAMLTTIFSVLTLPLKAPVAIPALAGTGAFLAAGNSQAALVLTPTSK